MEIVGTTRHGFLVDVSSNELFEMSGSDEFSWNGKFYRDDRKGLAIGAVIKLDSKFRRLSLMHTKRDEIEKVVRQLRAYADLLEPLESCLVLPGEDEGSGDE